MNYTPNLNLGKPEKAEQYNIDHWNNNMDIVDSAVQNEINTRTADIQTLFANLANETNARQTGDVDARNLANATGVLAVTKGGTGQSTVQNAIENLCGNIPDINSLLNTDSMIFKRSDSVNKTTMSILADKIYDLIQDRINLTIPLGVIYPFSGDFGTQAEPYANVPNGYLACDGQEVSRTQYARLFALIGTKYGNGDEINTFNVPDFRECVLVGAGQNATDTIAAHDTYNVGEFKDDQLQTITGGFKVSGSGGGFDQFTGAFTSTGAYGGVTNNPTSGREAYFNSSRVTRGGTTTHGKQKGVNYIIRY